MAKANSINSEFAGTKPSRTMLQRQEYAVSNASGGKRKVKWRVKAKGMSSEGRREGRRGQGDKQVASYCLYPPHMSRPPPSWQVWDPTCWPEGLWETCKWINIEPWESIGVLNDTSNDAHPPQSIPPVQRRLMNTSAACRQSHGSGASSLK